MGKILIVGGTGTIGSAVVENLSDTYETVAIGHTSGDYQIDLGSKPTIVEMYRDFDDIDAVICASGRAEFGPLDELSDEDFKLGLENKLMGQINLVRVGREHLNEGGSITLTSGLLGREPMRGSTSISTINAGLEGFVRAAALELEGGRRVNAVSPGWVSETLEMIGRDPEDGVPAATVAQTFQQILEGDQNGEVVDIRTDD